VVGVGFVVGEVAEFTGEEDAADAGFFHAFDVGGLAWGVAGVDAAFGDDPLALGVGDEEEFEAAVGVDAEGDGAGLFDGVVQVVAVAFAEESGIG